MADNLTDKQIEIENTGIEIGIWSYRDRYKETVEQKFDLTYFTPEKKLLEVCITPVSEAIESYFNTSGDIQNLIKEINPRELALITAHYCVNLFGRIESIENTYKNLGKGIPDHINHIRLRRADSKHFENILSKNEFKQSHFTKRMVNNALDDKGIDVMGWDDLRSFKIGKKLIELFINSTGVLEIQAINDDCKVLRPTEDVMSWREECHIACERMKPEYFPMVRKPNDWRQLYSGGYLNNSSELKVKMIKSRNKNAIGCLYESDGIEQISKAISVVQGTAWRINEPLLEIMKSCVGTQLGDLPAAKELDHWKMEKSKRRELNYKLWLAENISNVPEFYFVWSMDWRGRIYPMGKYLNPQSDDTGKALLEFSKGKKIGDRGSFWLAVHGANCFGKDKITFEKRIEFIKNHEGLIVDSARNPIDGEQFWCRADKPFQFLAFCIEWSQYLKQDNAFKSHLPIAMDGSCNGLQHFAALAKDPVVAKAVNLTPSPEPQDIYSEFAEIVSKLVEKDVEDGNKTARLWSGKVNRKMVKRPVMTFPYGASHYTFTDQILEELNKHVYRGKKYLETNDNWRAAKYLSMKVKEGFLDYLHGPVQTMDWMKKVAKHAADRNTPIIWTSPSGLTIYQEYWKSTNKPIIAYWKSKQYELKMSDVSGLIDTKEMAKGISPNFIHSLDASHLILSVIECMENGIEDFSMIHDSYACHACDTDLLHQSLRKAFVEMYSSDDLLQKFSKEVMSNSILYGDDFEEKLNEMIYKDIQEYKEIGLGGSNREFGLDSEPCGIDIVSVDNEEDAAALEAQGYRRWSDELWDEPGYITMRKDSEN